jgi:hypothetical protein
MNERIEQLLEQARAECFRFGSKPATTVGYDELEKFAELIIQECIDKIETHEIPVGNSAAGEMACEWTCAALKEIRDEIKEHFGVE